jgi:hypothetical protein
VAQAAPDEPSGRDGAERGALQQAATDATQHVPRPLPASSSTGRAASPRGEAQPPSGDRPSERTTTTPLERAATATENTSTTAVERDDLPPAVPRAGRAPSPGGAGAGGTGGSDVPRSPDRYAGPESASAAEPTTVLPASVRRPVPPRPAPPRPGGVRTEPRSGAPAPRPAAGRSRRARLALRRIDPWSVFVFSLIASLFVGVALVVAVAVLYSVLGSLGITDSLNQLFAEITGGSAAGTPLVTGRRIIGGAAVLAALNVVFLTLLATLASLLYNLCASFTGGIELTLGERD